MIIIIMQHYYCDNQHMETNQCDFIFFENKNVNNDGEAH